MLLTAMFQRLQSPKMERNVFRAARRIAHDSQSTPEALQPCD